MRAEYRRKQTNPGPSGSALNALNALGNDEHTSRDPNLVGSFSRPSSARGGLDSPGSADRCVPTPVLNRLCRRPLSWFRHA